jgi:hypothetical protein
MSKKIVFSVWPCAVAAGQVFGKAAVAFDTSGCLLNHLKERR